MPIVDIFVEPRDVADLYRQVHDWASSEDMSNTTVAEFVKLW